MLQQQSVWLYCYQQLDVDVDVNVHVDVDVHVLQVEEVQCVQCACNSACGQC